MQPRYHTKIPSIKGKFYKDIRDIVLERRKNATYLVYADAHSLCNRIKLSEPRDGSRAQNPQHVTRPH